AFHPRQRSGPASCCCLCSWAFSRYVPRAAAHLNRVLSACKHQLEASPPALSIDATERVGALLPSGMDRAAAIRILTAEKFQTTPLKSKIPDFDERLFSSKFFKL